MNDGNKLGKNVFKSSSSQNNPVNSFGVNGIKERIDASKSNNFNRNTQDVNDFGSVNNDVNKTSGGLKKANSDNDKNVNTMKGLEKKSNKSVTNSLKSAGGIVGNNLLNSASNSEDDIIRLGANSVKTAIDTAKILKTLSAVGKAVLAFFATPVGWVVGFILAIITLCLLVAGIFSIVVNSLGMKYGLTGEETMEYFNETYSDDLAYTQLDDIMTDADNKSGMCERGFFVSLKNFFGVYDLSNKCELVHYVKHLIETKQKRTDIPIISPGYFMSSLYYAFDTQNYREDGTPFLIPSEDASDNATADEIGSMSDLDAITTLMAVKRAGFNKNDVSDLLDNYVLSLEGTYDLYEIVRYDEITGLPVYECVTYNFSHHSIDENKFLLYLRYGKNVTRLYQNDLTILESYNRTDPKCWVGSVPDVSPYYNVKPADPDTLEDDNSKITVHGKTYGYDSGFIFTKYPRYKDELTIIGKVIYDYTVDKDIENIINNIKSRKEYTNYLLGYPSDVNDSNTFNDLNCEYRVGGVSISNVKVKLLHGNSSVEGVNRFDPIEGEELIDFEKYVMGVVYANTSTTDIEAIRVQAIMARSYALDRAKNNSNLSLKKEGNSWILEIRNSDEDQIYCDPDKGCSVCEGYNTVFTTGATPTGAKCSVLKGKLEENTRIRNAVKEVNGMVLVDESGNAVIDFEDGSQSWMDITSTNGLDYVEYLRKQFGSTASIATNTCTYGATGEWSHWRQFSPEWGGDLICDYAGKYCTMADSGCLITSYAMLLANSAPELSIPNFNPKTYLEAIKRHDSQVSNRCLTPSGAVRAYAGAECLKLAVPSHITPVYTSGSVIASLSDSGKVNKIRDWLAGGYDIVIHGTGGGFGARGHFIYVTGIDESGNILIADPYSDVTILTDRYQLSNIDNAQLYNFV